MLARSGEITAPCGVPVSVSDHFPSSITPALSHFWIRRRMRWSATRCSTNLIIHALSRLSKALDVGIKYVVHLLFHKRVRQRIQRLMLAASRTKTIREAEEVLLIDVVEDGDHCVLDDLVFQCGDPERPLPSVALLDVSPSRWKRPIRAAMHPAVQIGKPTLQPGFIRLPCHPIHAGSSLAFQRTEAIP